MHGTLLNFMHVIDIRQTYVQTSPFHPTIMANLHRLCVSWFWSTSWQFFYKFCISTFPCKLYYAHFFVIVIDVNTFLFNINGHSFVHYMVIHTAYMSCTKVSTFFICDFFGHFLFYFLCKGNCVVPGGLVKGPALRPAHAGDLPYWMKSFAGGLVLTNFHLLHPTPKSDVRLTLGKIYLAWLGLNH